MVSLWLTICIGKDQDVKCQKRSSRLLGALCKETSVLWNESANPLFCDWEDFIHWERVSWGVGRGCWEIGEAQWDFKANREWLYTKWGTSHIVRLLWHPRVPRIQLSGTGVHCLPSVRLLGLVKYSRGTQIVRVSPGSPRRLSSSWRIREGQK